MGDLEPTETHARSSRGGGAWLWPVVGVDVADDLRGSIPAGPLESRSLDLPVRDPEPWAGASRPL